MKHDVIVVAVAWVLVGGACGGGGAGVSARTAEKAPPDAADDAEPGKAAKPSAIEVLGITPPEQPWSEMGPDDREFYMIGKVEPITKEIFTDFDAAQFAEFTCETCHGEEAKERTFEMPTPELPPVPLPDTEAYAALEKDQPRMVRFMTGKVTPITRKLLGLPPYDPESREGFGCNGCHPTP